MIITRITIEIDIEHDDYVDLENSKEEILQSINGKKHAHHVAILTEEEMDF